MDDGLVNYFSVADAGISMANSNVLVPGTIWGVGDADDRNNVGAPNREFRGEGHSRVDRDSFYEMSIPLSHLNITATQLESVGIGVMIGMGLDTIPHDEATLDNPGVEVWNSSFEWGDADTLTAPFARIGAGR